MIVINQAWIIISLYYAPDFLKTGWANANANPTHQILSNKDHSFATTNECCTDKCWVGTNLTVVSEMGVQRYINLKTLGGRYPCAPRTDKALQIRCKNAFVSWIKSRIHTTFTPRL